MKNKKVKGGYQQWHMLMSEVERSDKRTYTGSKNQFQEISGLYMRLLVLKFSTKMSHKIHFTK